MTSAACILISSRPWVPSVLILRLLGFQSGSGVGITHPRHVPPTARTQLPRKCRAGTVAGQLLLMGIIQTISLYVVDIDCIPLIPDSWRRSASARSVVVLMSLCKGPFREMYRNEGYPRGRVKMLTPRRPGIR